MKLPKTQAKLLSQLQSGATLHYMRYMGSLNPEPYYFCSADNNRCTKAAEALIAKGLVSSHKAGPFADLTFGLTEAGKASKITQA